MSVLNDVCRELLVPRRPAAPSAPLSRAEQTAIEVARSWSRVILAPPFQPPDDATHIPSYADAASLDILRVWYPTSIGEILVAQTFCVFSVVIQGGARDVNAIAKQVFQQKDRIRLKSSGTEGRASYGEQSTPAGDAHRDWMGHLRWWMDDHILGFLTLKTADAPGRALMGWGAELNLHWFRSYREAR